MSRRKHFWARGYSLLMMVLSMILLLLFGKTGLAVESEGTQHYKMLSSVEYSGKTQFRNQVETLLTARKEFLSDDAVRYFISSSEFDLLRGDGKDDAQSSFSELSFVIDNSSGRMWGGGKDLALLERINNECVKSLEKVTNQNVRQTWKQSFKLSFVDNLLTEEIKLTLTAIQLKTKDYGEMIAVRALSQPFSFKAAKQNGGVGDVHAKVGAVYLFDPEVEDIYLSVSAFEATTSMNGTNEKLQHEVATYKTDAKGASTDLTGLGSNFERFVKKVGLSEKTMKVSKDAPLPHWARSVGLRSAQVASICAGTACEGASNPTAAVFVPAARTVAMQSLGVLGSIGPAVTISSALTTGVTGVAGMKIAAAPAAMGVGLGTAGAIAGGTTAIAVGAGGGSGSDTRSPSTP